MTRFEFPIIRFDIDDRLTAITAKFSNEVTVASERVSLNQAVSASVSDIFVRIAAEVEKNITSFRGNIKAMAEFILADLMADINKDFQELSEKFKNKEEETEKAKAYLEKLQQLLQGLKHNEK